MKANSYVLCKRFAKQILLLTIIFIAGTLFTEVKKTSLIFWKEEEALSINIQ